MKETLDRKHHAKCGLYCPSCSAYIATKEDPTRLDAIAKRFNMKREDFLCSGCGSNQVSYYCRTCEMKTCSKEKGLLNCAECSEMPCQKIIDFQSSGKPHRLEVIESLEFLKENGFEKWEQEQLDTYTCSQCKEINAAYDLVCRKCGNLQGNAFGTRHHETIVKHLETVK